MKFIHRALIVKSINYKANQYTPPDWEPGLVHEELLRAFEATTSIGERRYPDLSREVKDGQLCLFVNTYKPIANGSVLFTVCSYRHGHVPESFNPDFSKQEADVRALDTTDSAGNKGELVFTYRCIAYGQILIVELVQGSGTVVGLQRLLRHLLRKSSGMGRAYPLLELNNVTAPSLRELIESRGGVSKIKATLMVRNDKTTGKYAKTLASLYGKVTGTNKCVVEWESDKNHNLDPDTAIEIFEEASSEFLSGVSLDFKKGGGISDLSEYIEKSVSKIAVRKDGRPDPGAIEYALKAYLLEVCSGNPKSVIKSDGTLKNARKLVVG